MDRAYWGEMRWGKFRWGVYIPDWDNKILPRLKSMTVKQIGTDPPVMGWCRMGYTFFDVQYGLFQDLKKKLENR